MEEKKGIDVFQDGDITQEVEIFKDYSNTPTPQNVVNKKVAITAIIATLLVLMIAAGCFVGGFFFAKSKGIENDMPMLEEAYELVKKYYYEDITWDEFQKVATKYFITSLDEFAFMVDANQPAGSVALGIGVDTDLYQHATISSVVKGSPAESAEAINYCESPVYQENYEKFTYVNYTVTTDVRSEHVKIENGDRLIAVSFNSNPPIIVEGLSKTYLSSVIAQSDDLILYIAKSNGDGEFLMSGVYQYAIHKEYMKTKYAYLYTPAEIGDTTGTTAMIKFTAFDGSAIPDFYACAKEFKDAGYKNLILDIRGNGGGDSKILQYVASCLLVGADSKAEEIIYYVSNTGNGKFKGEYTTTVQSMTYDNGTEDVPYNIINLPKEVEGFQMTVLCDGNTASSSEALIGSLLFYNKVKLIGSTTFGKGIGQLVFSFNDYYLYIPNGRYYIPTDDGTGKAQWTVCIHGVGFTPDDENLIDEIPRPLSTDKAIKRALTVLNG